LEPEFSFEFGPQDFPAVTPKLHEEKKMFKRNLLRPFVRVNGEVKTSATSSVVWGDFLYAECSWRDSACGKSAVLLETAAVTSSGRTLYGGKTLTSNFADAGVKFTTGTLK
jgi:hypothetical protein